MNLENYIKNNRELLDTECPDKEMLWAGISKEIKAKSKKRFLLPIKVAASVILIVGFSFLLHQVFSIRNNQQLILAKIDSNLAKQEAEYQKQIKNYCDILQATNYNIENLPTQLDDVQYIDDLIQKYSEDLKKHGANEKLLKSLMDLYQKKIMLLSRILKEIEQSKKAENTATEI